MHYHFLIIMNNKMEVKLHLCYHYPLEQDIQHPVYYFSSLQTEFTTRLPQTSCPDELLEFSSYIHFHISVCGPACDL